MSVRVAKRGLAGGVLVGASLLLALTGIVAASPAGAAGRTVLTGSAPRLSKTATASTAASPTQTLAIRVYMTPRGGEAALAAAVAAVSTPGSSQYRHYLTPEQYRAQFMATDAAVASVRQWLTSAGVHVDGVEASHRYVSATGSIAALDKAFGVDIRQYTYKGSTVFAPSADASVPSSLASTVLGVTGLDTIPRAVHPQSPPPPGGFANGRPCSEFYGQIRARYKADGTSPLPQWHGKYPFYAICGYDPAQLRAAYGASATGLSGAGATVAITDAFAAPTILQDANEYATRHGFPPFASGQFEQRNSRTFTHIPLCGGNGWFGEETLDVEAVHSMAYGANVIYYGAQSCLDTDLLAALNRVLDDNRASIVTNSWGEPDEGETSGTINAYTQTFEQGAMQGVSFLFSSGDSGDEVQNTGINQSDSPASNPLVTAVGGTTTAIGPSGQLEWQTGWGTRKYILQNHNWVLQLPFQYGSGGGYSSLFNRPHYQEGVVDSAMAGRAVPDVAMDGDPTTGMLVGETQIFPNGAHYGEFRLGGTSLSSPLFAGETALATQAAGGTRLGFLNPAIYDLARRGSHAFLDVLPVHTGDGNVRVDYANGVNPDDGLIYSLRLFDLDSSLHVTPGWDDVTGVGSPTVRYPFDIANVATGGGGGA